MNRKKTIAIGAVALGALVAINIRSEPHIEKTMSDIRLTIEASEFRKIEMFNGKPPLYVLTVDPISGIDYNTSMILLSKDGLRPLKPQEILSILINNPSERELKGQRMWLAEQDNIGIDIRTLGPGIFKADLNGTITKDQGTPEESILIRTGKGPLLFGIGTDEDAKQAGQRYWITTRYLQEQAVASIVVGISKDNEKEPKGTFLTEALKSLNKLLR